MEFSRHLFLFILFLKYKNKIFRHFSFRHLKSSREQEHWKVRTKTECHENAVEGH